jgi:hypothetical protein
MSNFKVGLEACVNRTTAHPYQLHFIYKTKVYKFENNSIGNFGLTLTTIANIRCYGANHEFLVGKYCFKCYLSSYYLMLE